MFKKILFFILPTIIVLTLSSRIYSIKPDPKQVLLVYDKRFYFAYSEDIVTSVRELFGHFDMKVVEKQESDYVKNEIKNYDYIVVVGLKGSFRNSQLIYDLNNTEKKIFWMGFGIEKLINDSNKYNANIDTSREFIDIEYKNKNFKFSTKRNFNYLKNGFDNVHTYAWVNNGLNKYPLLINDNNLWYIGRVEVNTVLFYIICDALYEFLEIDIDDNNLTKVYIRIEDVHPFSNCEELKNIGEYLYNRNIPFMIALIPAYVSPETNYITKMSDKPEFIKTIQYLQKIGGSIVLHGFTHQRFGGETSGEGFEFWNGIEDKPIEGDIDEWLYERIEMGLRECVKNEIYPIAFEAPHYAISQEGYRALKKIFSTYVGHIQTADNSFTTTQYPFELRNTKLFNKFIPENLGYITEENPFFIDEIANNINELSVVRGRLGGVFYHSYLGVKKLEKLIELFENTNITYYDLRNDDHWVKLNDINIKIKDGVYSFSSITDNVTKNVIESLFSFGINVLLYVVFFICILLVLIFIFFKRQSNKKLFK